ncbi:hypothetical protein [Nocardioides sp.]|uniref:hypothetical protein n=1 Tax=Nocardioides sp. TaxID=35761 RepID=UPI0035130D4D
MPVADDHAPTTSRQLEVHLPTMRGYAAYLDRTSADLGAIAHRARTSCSNADFGRMLEDLCGDYETLLPVLHEMLAEQERIMQRYGVAVDALTMDFERTDDGVAQAFGGADSITGGGSTSTAFAGLGPTGSVPTPYPTESEIPEVSFGFVFDKLAWALEEFCGFDVRREVTDYLAGDVVGLTTQAICWEQIGTRVGQHRDGLVVAQRLASTDWEGDAATSHFAAMIGWDQPLEDQTTKLPELGGYLRDLGRQAVHTAQFVVDCIRLAIDLILGAWSLMYIPIVGQARFVKKAWDAYKQASKATAYLRMLWSFIRTVKDYFVVLHDTLTPAHLPAAPQTVAR